MGRLNRYQHSTLDSAPFTPTDFYNGFIAALNGLYVPTLGEQVAGDSGIAHINMLASIADRLGNVIGPVVYKDGADTDAQFRVTLFSMMHNGHLCTLAGTGPFGSLVTGTNYIWADLSAAPTVTIAFGSAWPTVPHLKIGSIVMPASGPWYPTAYTPATGWQAATAHRAAVHPIRIPFTFSSGASVSGGSVPADAIVVPKHVIITTAFDGSAPTLKLGDAGNDDSLIETGDADLTTIGKYDIDRAKYFATETALTAAIFQDSSAAGAGYILAEQW